MGILDEIKDIFSNDSNRGDGKGKNSNLLRNIIIIGMVGTLLLLSGNLFNSNNSENNNQIAVQVDKNNTVNREKDYIASLNEELEEIIGFVKGVGRVKVKVYVEEYTEYEYEYNTNTVDKITQETDQNSGQREINENNMESKMVVLKDISGEEKPVIRKKKLPDITGVLIVVEGAENSGVKYEVIKSVSRLLNLPLHKISVLPYDRG
ncbi:MAG: stage III sporulation protein AG [Halanaerobiaceae bacterium]